MGGRYPRNDYKRARDKWLSDFRRDAQDAEFVERPRVAAQRAARDLARMEELARRTAELDRLRGSVKMPTPPQLPLQQRPAWAMRDAAARAAANPHLARALARAQRLALRAAVQISPLGRIQNIIDLFGAATDAYNFVTGVSRQGVASWQQSNGWYHLFDCPANWTDPPTHWGASATNQGCLGGVSMGSITELANPIHPDSLNMALFGVSGGIIKRGQMHSRWRRDAPGTAVAPVLTRVPARLRVNQTWDADPLWSPVAEPTTTVLVRLAVSPATKPGLYVPRTPPTQGVRERKALGHGPVIRAIKKNVNRVTEGLDVFNCLYEALPDSVTGYKTLDQTGVAVPRVQFGGGEIVRKPFKRFHTKMYELLTNFDKLDLNKAIECGVKNAIEDRVIGTLASKAGPFGGKYGRPIGFTSGPAL